MDYFFMQLFQNIERITYFANVTNNNVHQPKLLPWRRAEFDHRVRGFDNTMAYYDHFLAPHYHHEMRLSFH